MIQRSISYSSSAIVVGKEEHIHMALPISVFDKFNFDIQLQIKVSCDIPKTKTRISSHLHLTLKYHLNVTCLVVRVISIWNLSIDVPFVFFTSHMTCHNLDCVCAIDMCESIFAC